MPALDDIEIRFVDEWRSDDLIELYKQAGWWKDSYDPSGLIPMIRGTYLFAVAVDRNTGRAVGMGRSISDGASDAYIQDVTVLESMRGTGIGGMIIRSLVDRLKKNGIIWIGLIAEGGSEKFYRDLGFREFNGKPMVIEPGE
ncbi:MAG: GNAT family N-acetyltransferase [Thermoplasmatota archaeon]